MKKVSMLMLAVLSITLFSFIALPGDGVTKIAEHLYTITPSNAATKSKVNQTDQTALVNLIKKEYKLTDADIAKGVNLSSLSKTGFVAVDKHIGTDWITTRCIWMASASIQSGAQIETILAKYTPR